MNQPTCRSCGRKCQWRKTPSGQWRLFEGDEQHVCEAVIPHVSELERYDEPIVRSDIELLARQVARLATAVEALVEQLALRST